MKARLHWKMILSNIVSLFIFLLLFTFSYVKITESNVVPGIKVLFPIWIFGTLGLSLLINLVLRTKTIIFTNEVIIIKRIFTFKTYQYEKKEIVSQSMSSHSNGYGRYTILHFRTNDGKVHSVVSYELRKYDEIVKWIDDSNAKFERLGNSSYFMNEWAQPFIIAVIVISILVILISF